MNLFVNVNETEILAIVNYLNKLVGDKCQGVIHKHLDMQKGAGLPKSTIIKSYSVKWSRKEWGEGRGKMSKNGLHGLWTTP